MGTWVRLVGGAQHLVQLHYGFCDVDSSGSYRREAIVLLGKL